MAGSSYDCIVIGAGPGGYVAAIRAAQLGKKTAVIEQDKVGGRCLNYACIPAKAVLRSADLLSEIREAGDFGLRVAGVEVDYPAVQARREKVVGTLTGGVSGLFKKNGIDVIAGEATLMPASGGQASAAAGRDGWGPIKVRVGEEELEAATVILATGSVGRSIPGVELGGRVIGTEQAWALPELPSAWRSWARAPRGRRSPPASHGWAVRCCCSRCSTACSQPRTPTSPAWSSAGSSVRAYRCSPPRRSKGCAPARRM